MPNLPFPNLSIWLPPSLSLSLILAKKKKTLSRNWNWHLTFLLKTLVTLNLHFSLLATKSEIFPKLESKKLAISEGHLKSKLSKTFTSNKPNWYPDWNFPFFHRLKVWEHFSHSSSCTQPVGVETVFRFTKFDKFLRRNLESKASIYIFLCCEVSEEANEALHGNNV